MPIVAGLSPLTIALALAILFAAALTKGVIGFGEGLLAMPLLTLLLGIRASSPLVGLVSAGLTALMLCANWQGADLRSAWRVLVGTLLGIPLGVWGLSSLPEVWVTIGLGAVLVLIALGQVRRPAARTPLAPRWGYAFGLLAGFLSGAYNIGGPPVVIYGSLQRWPPAKYRSTLQGCFLPACLIRAVGHGVSGLWTPQVLLLFALSIPAVLAALWLGGRLNRRVSPQGFERVVYAGLGVLGLMLMVTSLGKLAS